MIRRLAKQALTTLVLEAVGEGARKLGEVLADRATRRWQLQEVEVIEVTPKKKGAKAK